MKLKRYLNESIETDIQKFVNTISKEHKIATVKIKFSNKQLSGGDAYYQTQKIRGMKSITPVNITIGEWQAIKEYPDEWQHRLAHELAHHILAQTQTTLRHSKKHNNLTDKIEFQIRNKIKVKPSMSKDDIKKVKDKLNYWLDPINKMELIDYHGQKTYDNEIKKMQDKL
jgi:hypothetical protein